MNRAGRTLFIVVAFTILFIAILNLTNSGGGIMGGAQPKELKLGELTKNLESTSSETVPTPRRRQRPLPQPSSLTGRRAILSVTRFILQA